MGNKTSFKEGNKAAEKWTEEKAVFVFEDLLNYSSLNKSINMKNILEYANSVHGLNHKTFYYLPSKFKCLKSIRETLTKRCSQIHKSQERKYNHSDNKFKKGAGYVYLVKCEGTNFYKIGISKREANNRLSGLQSGCPFELNFVCIGYCDHYGLLEKELHNKYSKYRVRGEWFEFSDSLVLCVKKDIEEQRLKQLKLF